MGFGGEQGPLAPDERPELGPHLQPLGLELVDGGGVAQVFLEGAPLAHGRHDGLDQLALGQAGGALDLLVRVGHLAQFRGGEFFEFAPFGHVVLLNSAVAASS